MIKADVLITNKNWKKHIKTPSFYINKKLKKINKKLSLFKQNNFSFTILLSGDNEVKKLNNKNLNIILKKKKTQIYLGDIIINLNKMISKIKNEDFLLNFDKIWIHGLVHLLGYRHKLNGDFAKMTKVENKLVKFSK